MEQSPPYSEDIPRDNNGTLAIRLLGGFSAAIGGRTIPEAAWQRRKAASLVKLLALTPTHRLHREQVIDRLWPDLPAKAAANNLHRVLHIVRHIFEPALAPAAPSAYVRLESDVVLLCPSSPLWTDVAAFESAYLAARDSRDRATFAAALDLYNGALLPDDPYQDWIASHREELHGKYVQLLLAVARLHESLAEHSAAIAALQRVVACEPTHEQAHVDLMRLYAGLGQRFQALRQYQYLQETLRHELDIEPEGTSARLYQEILAGTLVPAEAKPALPGSTVVAAASPALPAIRRHMLQGRGVSDRSAVAQRTNLIDHLTSFVGRKQEIGEVMDLLASSRLLTLTGAGGCGKTRLALEVAERLVPEYADGVWLVELAGVLDAALVPQAMAAVLGVREERDRPLVHTLVDALAARHMLLVLDNCEHLVDACASLVDMLPRACPRLRIMTTSRQTLGVAGETAWLVPSLTLPDPEAPPPLVRLDEYDAIQLFLDRARANYPAFSLITPDQSSAVVQMCRRLDGIPLAIELAAARVNVLSVEQIAARLDDRFLLLTRGSRTAPPRHQTLRALVDWSYDLLSPAEQQLFSRLAVFAGVWTLEAAEAVAADQDAGGILDVLAQLVDKSLVVVEAGKHGAVYYRLLETLRAYGWERLVERGELEKALRLRALYYLEFVEAAERALGGPEQVIWIERLERQHDNLRAALDWSLGGPHRPSSTSRNVETALRLGAGLWQFWSTRGYLSEGVQWIDAALAAATMQPDPSESARFTPLLAKALRGAGQLASGLGAYAQAEARHEASLQLFRELADTQGIAETLNSLGMIACDQRNYPRAMLLHEESLQLFRTLGDARGTAEALTNLGRVVSDQNDQARAAALHEEALRLHRQVGDKQAIAQALIHLAMVVRLQGDRERARTLREEALMLHRELGNKAGIARALRSLAAMARDQGDLARAEAMYEESRQLFREAENKWGMALALRDLGLVAHYAGDRPRAAALYAEGLDLLRELGDTRGIAEALESLAGVERAHLLGGIPILQGLDHDSAGRATQLLGAAESIRAAIGIPHPVDHPAAYTHNLAPGHAVLGEIAFVTAWRAGREMSLGEAIAFALAVVDAFPAVIPKRASAVEMATSLTAREHEVAALVARGLTNAQIADALRIARRTVDTHVTNILRKLALASRGQLAAWAARHQLIPLEQS